MHRQKRGRFRTMIMPHLSAIMAILRTWQHPCLPSILDRRSRLQNRANCADEYQHEGHDMKVKMILPALTEAISPFFRPIKYSLFPPLGLATLAAYLTEDDEVSLQDEHDERLELGEEPELVVIQVYITSARRAY